MTKNRKGVAGTAPPVDPRLAEIDELTAQIRELLQEMVALARENPAALKPLEVLRKIAELQSAHLKVLEKEEAFHDKLRAQAAETIDYDLIRADIGRALDRIRAAGPSD